MQSSSDGDEVRHEDEPQPHSPRGRARARAQPGETFPTGHSRRGLLSSLATLTLLGVGVVVVVGVVFAINAASRLLNAHTRPSEGGRDEAMESSDVEALRRRRTTPRKRRLSRSANDDADCAAVAAVRREEEKLWYRLPPRGLRVVEGGSGNDGGDGAGVDEPRKDDGDDGSSGVSPCMADGRCVCCLDRAPRFMFLACLHECLCEPCLIRLGRTYEDTKLRGRFLGPVLLPCPLCREVGPVVQSLAP